MNYENKKKLYILNENVNHTKKEKIDWIKK